MSLVGARAFALTLIFLVSACDQFGWRGLQGEGLTPAGTPNVSDAADGLIVGHRMMAAGEYELALKSYTREIPNQGLSVDIMSALGSANLKLGRLQQAKRLLEQATEKDPNFVPAWNNLGVVQTSLGEFTQAHQSFRAAFSLDNGTSEEVWQNLLLAINNLENNRTEQTDRASFDLVRRGNGRYLLLETPPNRG